MPYSQTKARLALMRWTGWPQGQIMRMQPGDIDWKKAVFVRARRKGKGVAGAWLPLLPQAWRVLRTFKRLGAWGDFSTGAARKSLRLAAEKIRKDERIPAPIRIECEDVTPYQFRHTFGTMVAALTKDNRAVQALLQHGDVRQTERYTKAAVDPRVLEAMATVTTALKAPKPADHATAMPATENPTIH
jgi:integrase